MEQCESILIKKIFVENCKITLIKPCRSSRQGLLYIDFLAKVPCARVCGTEKNLHTELFRRLILQGGYPSISSSKSSYATFKYCLILRAISILGMLCPCSSALMYCCEVPTASARSVWLTPASSLILFKFSANTSILYILRQFEVG